MSTSRDSHVTKNCPEPKQLSEFLLGRLSSLAAQAIAEHLDLCQSCQDSLEELGKQADPLIDQLRISLVTPPIDSAEAARVVSQVQTLNQGTRSETDNPSIQDLGNDRIGGQRNRLQSLDFMQIRCPHCRNPVELVDMKSQKEVECSQCKGRFQIVAGDWEGDRPKMGLEKVAHFELLHPLGAGSFGAVWKARDTILNRAVAVKIPRKGQLSRNEIQALFQEAQAAAQVRHPNIVNVHEVGNDGNTFFIVSDYIDGESLAESLNGQPVALREAAEVSLVLAEALQTAHSAGVVHRDLKPANIIVDRQGQPHITDFGLAKQEATDVTVTFEGRVLGTPAYMSPEMARGRGSDTDARTDVYSLGVILFELLTGQTPFRGDIQMLVSQTLLDEPPRLRKFSGNVPRDLETICLKCLEKNPGRRYKTAGLLAADLRRWLADEPIHARPVSEAARLYRWCKRKPALATVSAILLAVIATATVGLSIAYRTTVSSLESAETNLYFLEISAAQQKWLANDRSEARAALKACPTRLRGFEWSYLETLTSQPENRLQFAGHSIAYSPDGTQIATTGGMQADIEIWDVRSRKRVHQLSADEGLLTCLDISPNGRLLVSSSLTGSLRLWDVNTGQQVRTLTTGGTAILKCRFNADGTRIVSFAQSRYIRVWEAATGKLLIRLNQERRKIRDIAVSPTESVVAVSSGRRSSSQVTIYDMDTGEIIGQIPSNGHAILSVAFSPDGQRLATAEQHGEVELWRLRPIERIRTISGPLGNRPALSFDSEGRRIAVEVWDGTIRVWDSHTGVQLRVLRGHIPPARGLRFSPDGDWLAVGSADDDVSIWETTVPQGSSGIKGCQAPINDIAISRNGAVLAAANANGKTLVWDAQTRRLRSTIQENEDPTWSVALSSDGGMLAAAGDDGNVRIYDIHKGDIHKGDIHKGDIHKGDIHKGDIHKGDLTEPRLVHCLTEYGKALRCVAISPDDRYVAAVGLGHMVRIWSIDSGELKSSFKTPGQSLRSIAFHPSGKMIATGDRNGQVGNWDLKTGQMLWLRANGTNRVWNLAWSPDGDLLAIAHRDGTIQLRQASDGVLRSTFGDVSEATPVDLAFCPDGTRLVTTTAHIGVTLWEIPTGRAVLRLLRDVTAGRAVAFHPSGQSIASSSTNGDLLVWKTTRDER